jgi:2-polyprenyl-6-methoxyphenol hydroxylase-like FAD-dependent oxidoreductase
LRIKKEKLMTQHFREMSLLILGGGAFGLSTAYHALKQSRFESVTILDRLQLPALDGIPGLILNYERGGP